jgi:uncharacterized BrkB/YihY/UPF0761 family membrane protein
MMTAPGDESDGSGEVPSPDQASGRIARAKARADEAKRTGAEILDREQARRRSVRVAVEAFNRDRRFAGGLLAGGLAFRMFLWLLPFSLVVVTLVGGLSDELERPASDLARDAGLSAALAGTVAAAVETSSQGRIYLLILGIFLLAWAGRGVAKALHLISGLAWSVPPGMARNPLVDSAAVVGVVVIELAVHLLIIRNDGSLGAVAGFLIETAVISGLMVWVFMNLPHAEGARWTAMVPGALMVALGVLLLRLVTVVYFAERLESVSDIYGALGLASVFLAWLYILGRVFVAGISLNASGHTQPNPHPATPTDG